MDDSENRETRSGTIKITAQVLNLKFRMHPHAWHPATDLIETDDRYIIKVEIAGMVEDELSVSLENNLVVIFGHRHLVNPEGAFHRLEIPYGDFSTSVEIPGEIVQDDIEAYYQNGFLTIMLPKAKPVTITINK